MSVKIAVKKIIDRKYRGLAFNISGSKSRGSTIVTPVT